MKIWDPNKNVPYTKLLSLLLFISTIVLVYQKIGVLEKLHERPTGEHAWAQIDRASMALTYYMDNAPFGLPRCHQATKNQEGITAGEFPLIPYTVSKIYKIYGFDEFYHRFFVLVLSLTGMLFSYLLALHYVRSRLWAFFASAIWLVSPNIVYYSVSFLPDAPALAFLCIAFYFLLSAQQVPRLRNLVPFSLFLMLAGLIKVSSLLPAAAVLLAYLISYGNTRVPGFKNKMYLALASLVPVAASLGWVIYARQILETYGIFTFLMEPMPPRNKEQFMQGLNTALALLDHYYINGFRWFLYVGTLAGLIFIRRSNKFLLLSALFIYLSGIALFFVLFDKAPTHHYYWLPFHLGVFFHVMWLVDIMVQWRLKPAVNLVLFAAALVFINYNAIHTQKNVKKRWEEYHDFYAMYYDLEPVLEKNHIGYQERVFSYSDRSFNNTLYLMNRKGWAVNSDFSQEKHHLALNACTYAVLNDTSIVENPEYKPYFYKRITDYNQLVIYKLQHADERTNSSPDSP